MSQKRNKNARSGAPSVRLGHASWPALGLPDPRAIARGVTVRGLGVNTLAVAVAGILCCAGTARAADEQTTAAAAPSDSLQEIVVTASAQGVRKLDASYNIVSLSLDEIKNSNPVSVADIFKNSPGIWPEASGGQTGANIDVAGFPNGGGDSPYFTTMINGSPLYGSADLSFMDSSSLLRFDDTIERVEIVQGGPSAIFSSGQAGATANFILRTGSDKTTGSVGFTYGSEHLYRVDAFVGGPIGLGWDGTAPGGFYCLSDGVRDPQFKADEGGQFTVTASHDLDGGSIMFWARTLQDKNQFIVPVPVVENSNGSFSQYPGFNALHLRVRAARRCKMCNCRARRGVSKARILLMAVAATSITSQQIRQEGRHLDIH